MLPQELKAIVKGSIFNKARYTVDVELDGFLWQMGRYVMRTGHYADVETTPTTDEFFDAAIPVFQRDNDKWDLQRKINFVENVVMGFKPVIQLYTTKELRDKQSYARCWILDGLQRTTALIDFIDGKFKIFDGKVTFQDLIDAKVMRSVIGVQIFTFATHVEAAEFYVQINKGITHSDEDIQRALDFIKANDADIDKDSTAGNSLCEFYANTRGDE
jgi:hypothetical protein